MKKKNYKHNHEITFEQIKIRCIQCDYNDNRSLFQNNNIFFNKIHYKNK